VWRVAAALAVSLALALTAALVLRKRMGGTAPSLSLLRPPLSGGRRLRLVERLRIGAQVELCIVECDGCDLLLAVDGGGAVLLARLSDGPPPAEARPHP
jgi:flagellar biogenesis protein FliO